MKRIALIPLLGALALCAKALFTYLDPGSGSLIVQLLIAFGSWHPRHLSVLEIPPSFNIWHPRGIKRGRRRRHAN